jgi:hypothetical protein
MGKSPIFGINETGKAAIPAGLGEMGIIEVIYILGIGCAPDIRYCPISCAGSIYSRV